MFLFQEKLMKWYSRLVYLHGRIVDFKGEVLEPVEKIKLIDLSRLGTDNKRQGKGASDDLLFCIFSDTALSINYSHKSKKYSLKYFSSIAAKSVSQLKTYFDKIYILFLLLCCQRRHSFELFKCKISQNWHVYGV
jgi:hypothetical protein